MIPNHAWMGESSQSMNEFAFGVGDKLSVIMPDLHFLYVVAKVFVGAYFCCNLGCWVHYSMCTCLVNIWLRRDLLRLLRNANILRATTFKVRILLLMRTVKIINIYHILWLLKWFLLLLLLHLVRWVLILLHLLMIALWYWLGRIEMMRDILGEGWLGQILVFPWDLIASSTKVCGG
jgi:hypothetical protein